jgi:PilZ domain-containing protein
MIRSDLPSAATASNQCAVRTKAARRPEKRCSRHRIMLWEKGEMPLNTKREARKLYGRSAWITLDGGFAARQCVVQDISSRGAKICVDEAAGLPAKLQLAFSRDARTGRECQVVWRRGKTAGVKFVR